MELEQLLEAVSQEKAKRRALVGHVSKIQSEANQIAELLGGEAPNIGKRPGYIKIICEVLGAGKKPMRIAEIRDRMAERPGMQSVKRIAIERTIFMELRKEHPRLKRVAHGVYTLSRNGSKAT